MLTLVALLRIGRCLCHWLHFSQTGDFGVDPQSGVILPRGHFWLSTLGRAATNSNVETTNVETRDTVKQLTMHTTAPPAKHHPAQSQQGETLV